MLATGPLRSATLWIGTLAMIVLCGGCGVLNAAPTTRPTESAPVMPDPKVSTIGPLFNRGIAGNHNCTASVLDSPAGNLILTAAHCVTGSGAGLLFAPGYHDGVAPYGFWTVQRAYADPDWLADEDQDHDYAILQVADRPTAGGTVKSVSLEATTGGNRLGTMPVTGQSVTIVAYNAGVNDEPVRCDTVVRDEGTFPAFDCPGFSGGTSGGPWLAEAPDASGLLVRALIGGPNYGGCVDTTSYSSAFGQPIFDLLAYAAGGNQPSNLPPPTGDGC